MAMLVTYDSSADALYIYLRRDPKVSRSVLIDESRVVDLDESGAVVGIEVISPAAGFELEDIIERFHLKSVKQELLDAAKEFRPAASA